MPANANFTIKVTLDEANDIRQALREKLGRVAAQPIAEMTEEQRFEASRIGTLLRRDFG